jgi:hypothetical protein
MLHLPKFPYRAAVQAKSSVPSAASRRQSHEQTAAACVGLFNLPAGLPGHHIPGTVGPPIPAIPATGQRKPRPRRFRRSPTSPTRAGPAASPCAHPTGHSSRSTAHGLFGPLDEGDDLSQMQPFGAENLATPAIFGTGSDSLRTGHQRKAVSSGSDQAAASGCCRSARRR